MLWCYGSYQIIGHAFLLLSDVMRHLSCVPDGFGLMHKHGISSILMLLNEVEFQHKIEEAFELHALKSKKINSLCEVFESWLLDRYLKRKTKMLVLKINQ